MGIVLFAPKLIWICNHIAIQASQNKAIIYKRYNK